MHVLCICIRTSCRRTKLGTDTDAHSSLAPNIFLGSLVLLLLLFPFSISVFPLFHFAIVEWEREWKFPNGSNTTQHTLCAPCSVSNLAFRRYHCCCCYVHGQSVNTENGVGARCAMYEWAHKAKRDRTRDVTRNENTFIISIYISPPLAPLHSADYTTTCKPIYVRISFVLFASGAAAAAVAAPPLQPTMKWQYENCTTLWPFAQSALAVSQ